MEIKVEVGENLRDVMRSFLRIMSTRGGELGKSFKEAFGINITQIGIKAAETIHTLNGKDEGSG